VPTPNLPTVARVAMLFQRDTRKFVNTFHVRNSVAWAPSDLAGLATIFSDWWGANYKFQCVNDVCLYQVQVRVYNPLAPFAYDLAVSPNICGTQSVAPLPGGVTASISWRSGLAGRRYRGRFYAVGIAEDQIDDFDRLSSTYVSSMGTVGNALITRVQTAGYELVIFHRSPVGASLIGSVVVENIPDSQRRRLPGRGT